VLGTRDDKLALGQEEVFDNGKLGRGEWREEERGAVKDGLAEGGGGGQGREWVRFGVRLDCKSPRKC